MNDKLSPAPPIAGFLIGLGWMTIVAAIVAAFFMASEISDAYGSQVTAAEIVWIASIGVAGLASGALLVGAGEALKLLAAILGRMALPSGSHSSSLASREGATSADDQNGKAVQDAWSFLRSKGFHVVLQNDPGQSFSAGVSRGMDFSRGFASESGFIAFAEQIKREHTQ